MHTGKTGSKLPLELPSDVPTYVCDEIAYIRNIGGGCLEFWFSGRVPVAKGAQLHSHRVLKLAMVWSVADIPRALRQVEAAATAAVMLCPDDMIGEPEGHG